MTVAELAVLIDAGIATGETGCTREVSGVYACDLLSHVMSGARKGDAWITVHTNINTAAVALLTEVACIILPEGIAPEEKTLERACREGIPVLCTSLRTYDICKRLP